MIQLSLLLVLGLLSGGADMPAEAGLTVPALSASAVQATPLDADPLETDLFRPIQQGVPLFVPTTGFALCDDEEENSCPAGCLCLLIRNVENCFC